MLNVPSRCRSLLSRTVTKQVTHIHVNISAALSTTHQSDVVPFNDLYSKHLSEWSIHDVSRWISSIEDGQYAQYAHHLEQQRIDGLSLQYLSESDLHDLGITIMGDRKHILHGMNALFQRYQLPINSINSINSTNPINGDVSMPSNVPSSYSESTNDANDIHIAFPNESNDAPSDSLSDTKPTAHIPMGPLPANTEDTRLRSLLSTSTLTTSSMVHLPQIENAESNISDNILRIEYDCPWSIEPFNDAINRNISELFLSSPAMSESSIFAALSTFSHDIDRTNHQLVLHGNFIELSSFIKDIYQLHREDICPVMDLKPRITHFLWDSGELQRIAKAFNVIPFIRRDGKLAFHCSTNAVYNAHKAIDAVKSVLKSSDCSSLYGALNTSIIGTLLSLKETQIIFQTKLARFGYIQYWNRGHSIFERDSGGEKFTRDLHRNYIYHLLLIHPFSPSNMMEMHHIIKELVAQVCETCWNNLTCEFRDPMRIGSECSSFII